MMSFLKQLEELRFKTPRLFNINIGSENSDYCTHSDKNKNCYLLFAANYNQDCFYGSLIVDSRDCVDCMDTEKCELCYNCSDIIGSYDCNYSSELKNCSNCSFCIDCIGCKNCFGCIGLRQKEYYFFNEKLSKAEYEKRLAAFDFKDREEVHEAQKKLEELEQKTPRRNLRHTNAEQCLGDRIVNSKNCFYSFGAHECQDCCYLFDCWRTKDCIDMHFSDGSELCYECYSVGLGCYNCNFSNYIRGSSDCEYCELVFNCKNCFGCVGLQNREYYILNKPYSKDEYFRKVAEIKSAMQRDGEYGKQLRSTYAVEDTAAHGAM